MEYVEANEERVEIKREEKEKGEVKTESRKKRRSMCGIC